MTERYALYDKHGRITGYVLRETPHQATYFRSGSRPPASDSPLIDTVCWAVGFALLMVTAVLVWAMATAA